MAKKKKDPENLLPPKDPNEVSRLQFAMVIFLFIASIVCVSVGTYWIWPIFFLDETGTVLSE